MVVWSSDHSTGTDSSGYSAHGRFFDSVGVGLGAQFQVNTYTTFKQHYPSLATDENSGFVVVWFGQSTTQYDVFGQRYYVAQELANGIGTVGATIDGSAPNRAWRYYYSDVPADATNLSIELFDISPSDVDLYVRTGEKPTLSAYDCRPYSGGTTSETCADSSPTAGRWWIGVNNYGLGAISFTVRSSWSSTTEIFADDFESGGTTRWSGTNRSPPPRRGRSYDANGPS